MLGNNDIKPETFTKYVFLTKKKFNYSSRQYEYPKDSFGDRLVETEIMAKSLDQAYAILRNAYSLGQDGVELKRMEEMDLFIKEIKRVNIDESYGDEVENSVSLESLTVERDEYGNEEIYN